MNFKKIFLTHPKLFLKLKCETKGENNERKNNGDMLSNSQHFGGRGAC